MTLEIVTRCSRCGWRTPNYPSGLCNGCQVAKQVHDEYLAACHQWDQEHDRCPQCLSADLCKTTGPRIFVEDGNSAMCSCGWRGLCKDLVSLDTYYARRLKEVTPPTSAFQEWAKASRGRPACLPDVDEERPW